MTRRLIAAVLAAWLAAAPAAAAAARCAPAAPSCCCVGTDAGAGGCGMSACPPPAGGSPESAMAPLPRGLDLAAEAAPGFGFVFTSIERPRASFTAEPRSFHSPPLAVYLRDCVFRL
ncbi:MAG TPA: hypothetical protein VGB20_01510 [bacterium]